MEQQNKWEPYEEYIVRKKWMDKMEPIAIMRMSYFFWNNFSYSGWDEYLGEQVLKAKEKGKDLIQLSKRGKI